MNVTFQQHASASAQRSPHPSNSVAGLMLDPAGRELQLDKRQHVTLRVAVGWGVQALSGAVWITQDWDIRDIVLEAGQSFAIDRPGTVLVSALDQATVCVVHEPSRAAAAGLRTAPALPATSSIAA